MYSDDPKIIRTYKCATAIGANLIVVADTADATNQTVKLPTGADPQTGVLGITKTAAVQLDAAGTQFEIDVVEEGCFSLNVKGAGTNINNGDFIGVHGVTGSGKKVVVGTASMFVGVAREAATIDDRLISVRLGVGMMPAS